MISYDMICDMIMMYCEWWSNHMAWHGAIWCCVFVFTATSNLELYGIEQHDHPNRIQPWCRCIHDHPVFLQVPERPINNGTYIQIYYIYTVLILLEWQSAHVCILTIFTRSPISCNNESIPREYLDLARWGYWTVW